MRTQQKCRIAGVSPQKGPATALPWQAFNERQGHCYQKKKKGGKGTKSSLKN